MFLKVVRAIAKPQTFAILDLLKRSSGMSVNEIAKSLKLSYMGVKQYCNELHKKGLVDTWRRPKDIGRPELSYRLTAKAAEFYPEVGNELSIDILASAQQLYGTSAPDKLLFNFFAKKTEAYLKKIKGNTPSERAVSFAKIRDREGYCAEIQLDHVHGFRVVEFHSLLKGIGEHYPSVYRMEEMMFARLLGVPVQRSEQRVSGLAKFEFLVALGAEEFGALLEKYQVAQPVVSEEVSEVISEENAVDEIAEESETVEAVTVLEEEVVEIAAETIAAVELTTPETNEIVTVASPEVIVAEEIVAKEVEETPAYVVPDMPLRAEIPAAPEPIQETSPEPVQAAEPIVEVSPAPVIPAHLPTRKKSSSPPPAPVGGAEQIEFLLVG